MTRVLSQTEIGSALAGLLAEHTGNTSREEAAKLTVDIVQVNRFVLVFARRRGFAERADAIMLESVNPLTWPLSEFSQSYLVPLVSTLCVAEEARPLTIEDLGRQMEALATRVNALAQLVERDARRDV